MKVKFDNKKLKQIADDKFGGVDKMYLKMTCSGVSIGIGTFTKWCYGTTSPGYAAFFPVLEFLIAAVPGTKWDNFIMDDKGEK